MDNVVHLHKLLGQPQFPFVVKIPSQLLNAWVLIWLDFAIPEVADAVSGRENIETAAKSVGRQIRRKHLGSRNRYASRAIPTKSAKQTCQSRRDTVTNISH